MYVCNKQLYICVCHSCTNNPNCTNACRVKHGSVRRAVALDWTCFGQWPVFKDRSCLPMPLSVPILTPARLCVSRCSSSHSTSCSLLHDYFTYFGFDKIRQFSLNHSFSNKIHPQEGPRWRRPFWGSLPNCRSTQPSSTPRPPAEMAKTRR